MAVQQGELSNQMTKTAKRDYWMLAEALAALLGASLVIGLLPFRAAAQLSSIGIPRVRASRVREVAVLVSAVQAWSAKVPWRVVCFQRGMALQWMMRRRGLDARLVYGIKQANGALAAHVWVELDGTAVIGGPEAIGFTPVTRFPATEIC
jgi:hypothetical protein